MGIQPVVSLSANGGAKTVVKAGEAVRFNGVIEVPPGAGSVIAAEWDFYGSGAFSSASPVARGSRRAEVTITHSFARPGIYFPALRGISQREGDSATPYARIQNLGRVRVIVVE